MIGKGDAAVRGGQRGAIPVTAAAPVAMRFLKAMAMGV